MTQMPLVEISIYSDDVIIACYAVKIRNVSTDIKNQWE